MTADGIPDATMSGADFLARYGQQQGGEEVSSCAAMPNSCHAGYPAVRVVQGELYELVETAHEILAKRSPRLFRYGGVLVHAERLPQSLQVKGGVTVPANTIILEPASKEWLQLELARIALAKACGQA